MNYSTITAAMKTSFRDFDNEEEQFIKKIGKSSSSSSLMANNGKQSLPSYYRFSLARLHSAKNKNLASVSDIETIAQKKGALKDERFKVTPDVEYPDTYMNREELRQEMNEKSAKFHELKLRRVGEEGPSTYNGHVQIGELQLEILQCFGLPTSSLLREVSAYCTIVCGPHAFKTDTMPPVANPMWLRRMRRACLIPIYHGFARLYIGCFDHTTETGSLTDFIGRVVVDIARLRPMCTYDITIPFRESAHVYERHKLGSIRVRIHLQWNSERAVVLSYLPKAKPKFKPNEEMTINCVDDKSFRDVALAVHGKHMPGHFSMRLLRSTVREVNFTQIHIMRYLRKREIYNLKHYVNPFISTFVFLAWMHCVYVKSVQYAPGHILTYILLHLWKNYAYYCIGSKLSNGFLSPTVEELFCALVFGSKQNQNQQNNKASSTSFIEPLDIIVDKSHSVTPTECLDDDDDYEEANADSIPLTRIAESMRQSIPLHTHAHHFKKYSNCFFGTDAVDFLVTFGFASTRDEAVILGRKLERESKLFEHVGGKHKFDDEPHHYYFLQYDTHKYIIKGHEPMGKEIFKAIGFLDGDKEDEQNTHVPFPFATGKDHPRFTVKQSLVVRSKRGKKLLKEHELEQLDTLDSTDSSCGSIGTDAGDDIVDGFGQSHDPKFRSSSSFFSYDIGASYRSGEFEYGDTVEEVVENLEDGSEGGVIIEEEILQAPSSQDLSVVLGKRDKSLPETLQDTRHRVHDALLHVFNDRTYRIDQKLFSPEIPTGAAIKPNDDSYMSSSNHVRILFSKLNKQEDKIDIDSKCKRRELSIKTPYGQRKNEYDKLLNMNKYSSPTNLMKNRIGVILQPILEIVQAFLFLFRAMFNIFTWQDPILSFWVALLGPVVVLIFHFCPWRTLFGIIGFLFIGPQNWVMRVMKEQNGTYETPNFDRTIKKKEQPKELDWGELLYFSKETSKNDDPVPDDPKHVKQIIVPYSKLKYSPRFYDWPPEPEYAKVYASQPRIDGASHCKNNKLLQARSRRDMNSLKQRNNFRVSKMKAGDNFRVRKIKEGAMKMIINVTHGANLIKRFKKMNGKGAASTSLQDHAVKERDSRRQSADAHHFREYRA